ncbi:MAG: hypothetical protein ACRYG7_07690 [Janthinobacterium lividum]
MAEETTETLAPLEATKQLVLPPISADSFEIDGIVYSASEDISIKRYKVLQKLELQFGFDSSFRGLLQAHHDVRAAINDRKGISEIAYINEGVLRGFENINRQEVFQLHVVALWYNAPFENILEYNHEAMVAKMNRWEAGGLGMGFLFAKAAACVRGFRDAWQRLAEEEEAEREDQEPPQSASDPSPSPQ